MADGTIKISTDLDTDKLQSAMGKLGSVVNTGMKVAVTSIGAAATAFAGLTVKALGAGAELEQSVGGIETMFKENAGIAIKNAEKAYKTAGVSAVDYMNQIMSFSASLLQSLGGDTAEAAKIGDMAIIDMSDNANKFGSDITSIQNAYQGFAKQNYTMLDNLKLGYGGTKAEMERLLEDATKLSGIEYNIDNLADVYNAIHVIQEELGVTGTTAKEGMETLSGAIQTAKAAFENFLSGAGDANVDDFVEAFANLGNVAIDRLQELLPRLSEGISKIIQGVAPKIPEMMAIILPTLITGVSALLNGLIEALPSLLKVLIEVLPMIGEAILESLPILAEVGKQLIDVLIQGITEAFPGLEEPLKMIGSIFKKLAENINIILPIIAGIVAGFAAFEVISKVIPVFTALQTAFTGLSAAVTAAGGILPALGAALSALVTPVGLVVAAVAALVAGFVYLMQTNEEFATIMIARWESIKESILGIVESIKGIWDGFIEGLKENGTLQEIADTFIGIWNAVTETLTTIFYGISAIVMLVFRGIDNFLKNHGDAIKTVLVEAWTFMWGIVEPILDFIKVGIEALGTVFSGLIEFIISVINGDWSTAWAAMGDVVGAFGELFAQLLLAMLEIVGNIFTTIFEIAVKIWTAIVEYLVETVNNLVAQIIEFFQQLPYNIGVFIGQVLQSILDFGASFHSWVNETLLAIIESIVTFFAELPNKLWDKLQEAIEKVVEFGDKMKSEVKQKIPEVISTIIEAFKDLPSKLTQVGKDAIQGLINGIQDMAGNAKESINKVGSDLVSGIKGVLKSNSPSKVMIGVGEGLPLGLAIGIKEEGDTAIKAMKDVGNDITKQVAPEFNTQINRAYTLNPREHASSINSSNSVVNNYKVYLNVDADKVSEVQNLLDIVNNAPQEVRSYGDEGI